MDDALGLVFFEQGVSIGVRIAVVHDDGLVQLQRQPDVCFKHGQLGVLGHRPVVVQPALPHSYHLGVLVIRGQSAHLCGPVPAVHRDRRSRAFLAAVGGGQQAFRVDANSCHHPRVAVRQLQHFGCIPGVGGLFTHAHHALAGQAAQ